MAEQSVIENWLLFRVFAFFFNFVRMVDNLAKVKWTLTKLWKVTLVFKEVYTVSQSSKELKEKESLLPQTLRSAFNFGIHGRLNVSQRCFPIFPNRNNTSLILHYGATNIYHMGEEAMKGERRIFGGQKLHISDGNIVLCGLFVSWKCSVPMFSREEAKSICKNIFLKVFIN